MADPIRVEGLVKEFRGPGGAVRALGGLSFAVGAGEFVSVLGTSGCGKTTLLRCVAGLEVPTAGRVYVGDQAVTGPGPDRALIFQEAAAFPWRTVYGNLAFPLEVAGVPAGEQRERIRAHLDLVGLSQWEALYPQQLSGGMRQRLCLAMQLIHNPRVLLMDEPFAALDVRTRADLQDELLRIWAHAGVTVLFVTHMVAEALHLADRVLVLGPGGRLLAEVDVGRRLPGPRRARRNAGTAFRSLVQEVSGLLGGPVEEAAGPPAFG